MNFFYHHLTYIEVQKIQDLCLNFIIISLIFILCMIWSSDYYNFD